MPDDTAKLGLPLLRPAQAQKHVTHNEALARLDLLVQLTLAAVGTNAPPADPAEGEIHAVGPAASGDWAGAAEGTLAAFHSGGWELIVPGEGWRAWDRAAGVARVRHGGTWAALGGGGEEVARLGVNTAADTVNRLSVASAATLLSHAGAGHQVKVNKAAAADTASLLFQTGWSGRAEMGTTGSDAFSVKVSADGASWRTGLRIDGASGIVSAPRGIDGVQFTVGFDAATSVTTPTAGGFAFLSLVDAGYPQNPANAILVYDTGSSPALTTVWAGSQIDNLGTQTLTGTTGTAGRVSVAVDSAGRLHVENRFSTGGTRQFSLTFMNGFRAL